MARRFRAPKTTKLEIAQRIIRQNLKSLRSQVRAEMHARKYRPSDALLDLARETLNLPPWKEEPKVRKLSLEGTVRKEAAIRTMISKNRTASNPEIKRLLAQDKVTTGTGYISVIRSKMQKESPKTRFKLVPKSMELTVAQQSLIPDFQRMIGWALNKHIFPAGNWSAGIKQEFREFAEERIPRLIINYSQKGPMPIYVLKNMRLLRKKFVYTSLKQKMGLTHIETITLVRIIREKGRGLEDNAAIAAKLGCTKELVNELWEAYRLFSRIDRRT